MNIIANESLVQRNCFTSVNQKPATDDLIKYLISKGADVNTKETRMQRTPLHDCAECGESLGCEKIQGVRNFRDKISSNYFFKIRRGTDRKVAD